MISRSNLNGILGKDSSFAGTINFTGIFRIDGYFQGTIQGGGDKDIVMIGSDAVVEAEILANHVIIAGQMEGSIKAIECLHIQPAASLKGIVYTSNFIVESDGKFQGECISLKDWTPHKKEQFRSVPFSYSYQEYKNFSL